MKNRRPRKLKKKLKVKFRAIIDLKNVRMALSSVQAAFRVATISSSLGISKSEKALAVLETVSNAGLSIQSIINEKPTSWKEC